ncbi:MAG: SBBP repeat-containing protein [Candidatus Promineifilaceae bacterium]
MIKQLVLITCVGIVLLGVIVNQPRQAVAQQACANAFVEYSTLLGNELEENGNAIAVDSAGNAYVSGTTYSAAFLTRHQQQHGVDVVSVALNGAGSSVDAALLVNPLTLNAEDEGFAIALDGMGNRYVAGRTSSADFCEVLGTSLPGFDPTFNGGGDGFLLKINASHQVELCTYIGGDQFDVVRDVAVSAAGNVFITGGTWSNDGTSQPFPNTISTLHAGLRDTFVMQFEPDGTLVYSTLFGGVGQEEGLGIAVNSANEAVVTGWSNSADLPTTTPSFDDSANGEFDAFVFKLSADGATRAYAAYLGGNGEDRAYAIALDADDKAYVVGTTVSADFPTSADAFQPAYGGSGFSGYDSFLSTIAADGSVIEHSTYIGSAGEERAYDVAVSGTDVYVTGFTTSAEFPTTSGVIQHKLGGVQDAFFLKFRENRLLFSTFWGGENEEVGNGIAVRGDDIYLVGESRSAEFCTTATAYDSTPNGDYDMFVTKFSLPTQFIYLPIAITHND